MPREGRAGGRTEGDCDDLGIEASGPGRQRNSAAHGAGSQDGAEISRAGAGGPDLFPGSSLAVM
jgi:hypothetical protein